MNRLRQLGFLVSLDAVEGATVQSEVLEGELNGRELEATFSFASEVGSGIPTGSGEAAPDIDAFNNDTGPGMGMFLIQNSNGVAAEDLLQGAVDGVDRTETNRADHSDAVFTGRYAELDCGTVLGLVLVAVPDSDPGSVVFVAATAASQADLRAIDEILASFNIL